jgi:hypothetical protein
MDANDHFLSASRLLNPARLLAAAGAGVALEDDSAERFVDE